MYGVPKEELILEIVRTEIAIERDTGQLNTQRLLPHEFRANGERYKYAINGAEVPELDFARGLIRGFSSRLICLERAILHAQNAEVESVDEQILHHRQDWNWLAAEPKLPLHA